MRRYVNAGHMSNPFTYRDSPIISEDKQGVSARDVPKERRAVLQCFQQGPVAGARAPVVILTDANNNRPVSELYCFGHSFVVLYFCTDADAGQSALCEVSMTCQIFQLRCIWLCPNRQRHRQLMPSVYCSMEKARVRVRTMLTQRTLYLVRPDRHIAARRFESDLGELPMLLRYAVG